MDKAEILEFITQAETEDLDPVCVAKLFAAAIDDMQSRINNQDMQRLLLIGAAMLRTSIRGKHVELQLPASDNVDNHEEALENASFNGVLH